MTEGWLTWAVLAAATFGAVLALLWPALRGTRPAIPRAVHDAALYRAQLEELDRDHTQGRIDPEQHRQAVVEVQRRLLAAGEIAAPVAAGRAGRWLMLGAAVALPAVALAIYLPRGTPRMPAFPFAVAEAGRRAEAAEADALIGRVRARIASLPPTSDEAREGWVLLAGVESRRGNIPASIEALRRAIAIRFDAGLGVDLAEGLVLVGDGAVGDEAMGWLRRAQVADPADLRVRYYLALGALQRGEREAAIRSFRAIIAESPPEAPWLPLLRTRIAEAGGPSPDQVAAVGSLPAEQQNAMVERMVAGLAERLATSPDDAEGWLRLARAYRVLGRSTDARTALDRAGALLPGDPRVAEELAALRPSGPVP